MFKRKPVYEVGDRIADMHWQVAAYLPSNLRVKSHIFFRTDKARETMDGLVYGAGNKVLVVVDTCGKLVAAYTYDARYFGLVELEYVKEE